MREKATLILHGLPTEDVSDSQLVGDALVTVTDKHNYLTDRAQVKCIMFMLLPWK